MSQIKAGNVRTLVRNLRRAAERPPASPLDRFAFTGRDGEMNLVKLATGDLWLTNGAGEGMTIKDGDKKFQACLREYFNQNF